VIDAAFVYLPVPEGLTASVLRTEPRVVCMAVSDPLAQRQSVSLADLADRPMVNLGSDTFHVGRDYWAHDPRPDGTRVRYTDHQVTRFESLLSAVSLGRAIAFVPAAAMTLYPRPDLRYLPVDDLPGCAFGVVWHSNDHDKPKIVALEDIARRVRRAAAAS
jgi:DNA-binding transcriptional LysR family regulator